MTTRKANTNTTTQTKAQQEELQKLRARRAAAVEAEPVVADSTVGYELNEDESLSEMAGNMAEMLGLPSWKRAVIGLLISGTAAAGVSYGGSMVVSLIMAGATASGFYFLGLALAVVAVIITAYLAIRTGARAMSYICSGKIDEHAVAVKNKVFGWFTPNPKSA